MNSMEVFMRINHDNDLSMLNEAVFSELYVMNTILQMTKKSCQELEFSGEYYGMSEDMAAKLSMERNNYINMINLMDERTSNLMNLNLTIEKMLCYKSTPTMAAER